MEKRRSREDIIADFYFLMGDYSEDITRLLSEVHSKQTKATVTSCNEINSGYKEKKPKTRKKIKIPK